MKNIKFLPLCFLLLCFVATCGNPDRKANSTFVKASGFIEIAKASDNYQEALKNYHEAVRLIRGIQKDFPSSQLAVKIAQGEISLGIHSLLRPAE